MPGKADTKPQRVASLMVKTDPDLVAEVERLAAAARVSRDTYVTYALRHYLRFHALTERNRVRWVRNRRVTQLFPRQAAKDPPRARSDGKKRRPGS